MKDTVRRQSLLYHLCSLVLQTRPNSSDLYSEIPALTRCAKVSTRQRVHLDWLEYNRALLLGVTPSPPASRGYTTASSECGYVSCVLCQWALMA